MPEFCKVEREGQDPHGHDRTPGRSATRCIRPANFELEKVFDDFAADPDLWVAIVTGEGDRAFCAGNDLKYQAAGDGSSSSRRRASAGSPRATTW